MPLDRTYRALVASGHLLPWTVVAVLALFATLCAYCWPAADDYAIAQQVNARGYLGAQVFWYEEWTGKFVGLAAMSAFVAVFDLVEQHWLAPALILVATAGAAWFAVRAIPGIDRRKACGVALLLTALWCANVAAPQETLYWLTGAYAYQVGVVCLLLLVGLLTRHPRSRAAHALQMIACFAAAVGAAGSVETLMLPLLVAAAGWLCFVVLRRTTLRPAAAATALGVFAAATVMVLAPGNSVRGAAFADSHDLVYAVSRSTSRGLRRFAQWSLSPSMVGAALLFGPTLTGLRTRWRAQDAFLYHLLGAPFAVACGVLAHFPAYWAMGAQPPPRAVGAIWGAFACLWFLVLAPAAGALCIRFGLMPRIDRRVLGRGLLALGLLLWGNTPRAALDLLDGSASRYAAACAKRHRASLAAAARGEGLRTPPLERAPPTIFFSDLHADPTHIDNRSYAAYYGLVDVATEP